MSQHIRANLLLLAFTVILCCVVYPVILLAIGQTVFHDKAEGSLVSDKDGNVIGSKLIAQPFTGDEYFHPRPSAVSYNAAGSGASNWGANNPALRKRVVGMLGGMLKYKNGKPVGPDIVAWVKSELTKDRAVLAPWNKDDANLAGRWGAANSDFLKEWEKEHASLTVKWRSENAKATDVPPDVLAGLFFDDFAANTNVAWPETDGQDLQSAFFELWWKAHPLAELEPIPADMVMASGSGLDPHITLKAARYQLGRVAAAWASKTGADAATVRREIEQELDQASLAPLSGLVGEPIVNVLEVNLALKARYVTSP